MTSIKSKDLAYFVDSIIGMVWGVDRPVLMLSDSNQLKFAQNQHQDSPESVSVHHPIKARIRIRSQQSSHFFKIIENHWLGYKKYLHKGLQNVTEQF